MGDPFDVVVESAFDRPEEIASPFEDPAEDMAAVDINGRRAAAENAEALRLARSL